MDNERSAKWLAGMLGVSILLALSSWLHFSQASSLVVNSLADTDDGACDSLPDCTLREAVNAANASAGADDITFSVTGVISTTGSFTLTDDNTVIDASSVFGGGPLGAGAPGIEVNGPDSDASVAFVVDDASGVRLSGLFVTDFDIGIRLQNGASNNTIGTDADGWLDTEERNVISGMRSGGVEINGASTSGNAVTGNFIGTTVTGTAQLNNPNWDILIEDAPNNTVGGSSAAARNVIAGSSAAGVQITGSSAMSNTVSGNYIGTDATGMVKVGEAYYGIWITDNASLNTIGGTSEGERNVISGHNRGVYINANATGNVILGNYIGTDASGTTWLYLGNRCHGIEILADNNTVGGTASGARNVISGSGINCAGIYISADGVSVVGNYIGTDAAGMVGIGNSGPGISLSGANHVVGGTSAAARNVISANAGYGIDIFGGATNATVQGNYIGTDASGMNGLGNKDGGVRLSFASGSIIGGTQPGAGNLISGNGISSVAYGVHIEGGDTNSVVQGNIIGADATGTGALGNTSHGILIAGDAITGTVIGGMDSAAGNTIVFNGGSGIAATGSSSGNAILSNHIFDNAELGIDLGSDGVTANDASDSDAGPNGLQNFPVLTSATGFGSNLTVEGTLNSTAALTFTLQLFASTSCDSSSYGEGKALLASEVITTNMIGETSFTVVTSLPGGHYVTATATDPDGNTSEFSECAQIDGADMAIIKSDEPDPAITGTLLTYTLTITNYGPQMATGVIVTDTLPASFAPSLLSPSQGSCFGVETIVCTLGTLANSDTATVIIAGMQAMAGTFTNTATVAASELDLNLGNNTAFETTTFDDPFQPTITPTPTATPIPTFEFTPTPTATPIPTFEFTPTPTATPIPTFEFTPTPTATPTPAPGNIYLSFHGDDASDYHGRSIAGLGDVNGDGYGDVIVGAEWNDPGGVNNAGSAYVYSGQDGSLLHQFDGQTADERFGFSVANAGDVDGDSVNDILIGAIYADPGGRVDAGTVSLYSGANWSLLHTWEGQAAEGRFGIAVAGVGDTNGDGVLDVLIGADRASPGGENQAGSAYVYSASASAGWAQLYNYHGEKEENHVGCAVDSAGDVDKDGRPDFIIGAWRANVSGSSGHGKAFVYSGATGNLIHEFVGSAAGDNLGISVAGVGDINGDGYDDLLVGAQRMDNNGVGTAYLYSGATGSVLHQFDGEHAGDVFGCSVAGLGDVDGDGVPDLAIGANRTDVEGLDRAGSAYVYSGAEYAFPGYAFYRLDGSAASDRLGAVVAWLGDVNKGGWNDVGITAPHADPGGIGDAGSAFVVVFDPVSPTPTPTPTGTPSPTPTHTPIPTPTPTLTPSPTPTPGGAFIIEVRPAESFDDVTVFIDVFGFGFEPSAQVGLSMSPAAWMTTVFIDSTHLMAEIPAGLATGVYDLVVDNDGDIITLVDAYTVLDASQPADDLRAWPYHLWTDPAVPLEGENVSLGLVVERVGGTQGLAMVPVRFYQGALTPAMVIGDAPIAAIGVNDTASTAALDWGTQAAGNYTIFAEIDPDGTVPETNELNNVISRTVTILPPLTDTMPPVVTGFWINGGASRTATRGVTLTVTATDDTAPTRVFYVEQHYNIGARTWVPVHWTSWLPYDGQPHTWTLHPATGLRYLQAWIADAAGNVSAAPMRAQINYMPGSDQITAGEIKVYRQTVESGYCLRVRIQPVYGDPDLYVWPPAYDVGNDYWYSIQGPGEVDELQLVAPSTGNYQIEVDGITNAEYTITVEIESSCIVNLDDDSANAAATAKTPRTQPKVPTDSEPPGQLAPPTPPREPGRRPVYLPLVLRS